jgi:hypothetical protein
LVKSGHASCVINGHRLSIFGSPSRFNCSQSAIGLSCSTTFDHCPQVAVIPKFAWTRFHSAATVTDADSTS